MTLGMILFLLPLTTVPNPVIPIAMLAFLVVRLIRGSEKYEFCERGVRRSERFSGPWELHVDDVRRVRLSVRSTGASFLDTKIVNFELEPARGTDARPIRFERGSRRDVRRLVDLAVRYSRPVAKRMWRALREEGEVEWTPTLWLTRHGVARPSSGGGDPEFIPFAEVRSFSVAHGRYFIGRCGPGPEFEGESSETNLLVGQVVFEKILARLRRKYRGRSVPAPVPTSRQ
jgi:hypothetical protein